MAQQKPDSPITTETKSISSEAVDLDSQTEVLKNADSQHENLTSATPPDGAATKSTSRTEPINVQSGDGHGSEDGLKTADFAARGADQKLNSAGQEIQPAPIPETLRKLTPEQVFEIAQRIPVQIFVEETRGQKLSYFGTPITALLSLIVAAIVGGSAIYLNNRQIDLQTQQIALNAKQTDLQTKQTETELAHLRFNFLADLTDKDENKRVPAEIGLAGHGLDALPVVHFALGVEHGDIRDSAVNVVYRMFQAASFENRDKILEELMREFDSPNQLLHTGIVQSLVKIQPLLNRAQSELVIKTLNERFPPNRVCSDEEGRKLMKQAASFFPINDSGSISQLLRIIRYPRCGDGWFQAIAKLQGLARVIPEEAHDQLPAELESIEKETLSTLRRNVTNNDLRSGGFQFVVSGQLPIKFDDFDDFEKQVISEFKQLKELLQNKR